LQTRDTVTVGNNLNVLGGLTAGGSALVSGALSISGKGVASTNYTLFANGVVAGTERLCQRLRRPLQNEHRPPDACAG